MFDPSMSRPPAPELSPDEFLTVLEFGIHADAYEEADA